MFFKIGCIFIKVKFDWENILVYMFKVCVEDVVDKLMSSVVIVVVNV